MKIFLPFFLLITALPAFSQSSSGSGIKLTKGQVITMVSEANQTTDMGMGGEMKMNTKSTNTIAVTEVNADNYRLSNTVNKLKADMEMMGQQINFDSEKPAAEENEMTKTFQDQVGKSEFGSVNMMTGKFEGDKKSGDSEGNPLQELMGGNQESGSTQSAFFIIPPGKMTGDTWTTSETGKDSKKNTTYKLVAVEKDIASISFDATQEVNTTAEMQGMEMAITMNTKVSGLMSVNNKTGLVQKLTSNTNADGTIDVMGQSTPITTSGTSTVTFSY